MACGSSSIGTAAGSSDVCRRRHCARPLEGRAPSRLAVADLTAAAVHVLIERLADRGIERGLLVLGERSFPDFGRPLGRVVAAGDLPVLVALPVRDQRLVESMLIALEGMRLAEEMAAGLHAADRLEAELGLLDLH